MRKKGGEMHSLLTKMGPNFSYSPDWDLGSDVMEEEGKETSLLLRGPQILPHRCVSAVPDSPWAASSFLSPWINPQCTHGKWWWAVGPEARGKGRSWYGGRNVGVPMTRTSNRPLLTSAISCLLSTTRSGTLSKMERNFSTASSNLPTVVSW